jgi:luciferase-like monooxygenase
MEFVNALENEVAEWPEVSVRPHRFGGKEFRFRHAEVGHVHENGIVDIPFPRAVRDALLAKGLAEEHHWVPNSGWTTLRVRNEKDVRHALWLLRLCYERYASKAQAEAAASED